MRSHETEKINREYYNRLYASRNRFVHLLHSLISFDQQSKSKPNWSILRKHLLDKKSFCSSFRLLDYGSGWGTFILKLPAQITPYCHDISENSIEMLQATMSLLKRQVLVASVDSSGIEPKDFHVIVCSHVLEHVPNDIQLLETFVQSLTPNGLLLLNVPINEVWEDPKHIRKYTRQELERKLQMVGIEIVQIKETDKWTGFLLDLQMNRKGVPRISLRFLRFWLAVLPEKITQFAENIFVEKYPPQQLIVLGRKSG